MVPDEVLQFEPPPYDSQLLQAQHPARGQQANRFVQTPAFRFLPLGGVDPGEIASALLGGQGFEGSRRRRMLPQRCLQVGWKLRRQFQPWRSWSRSAFRRGSREAGRLKSPTGLEYRVPLPVEVRPSAGRSSRGKLDGIASVIQTLDETVHPPKAEGLVDRILVRDRHTSSFSFVEDEPHFGL